MTTTITYSDWIDIRKLVNGIPAGLKLKKGQKIRWWSPLGLHTCEPDRAPWKYMDRYQIVTEVTDE